MARLKAHLAFCSVEELQEIVPFAMRLALDIQAADLGAASKLLKVGNRLRKGRLRVIDKNPKLVKWIINNHRRMTYAELSRGAKKRFGPRAPSHATIHRWCRDRLPCDAIGEGRPK